MCETLIESLLKSYREGKQADGGFKGVALKEAERAISAVTTQVVSTAKIETKYEFYKRIWKTWKEHIRACSGWGVREDGLPIEDPYGPEATELYFETHINRRQFRDNLPPFFPELEEILSDRLATGGLSAAYEELMDKDSAFNRMEEEEDEEPFDSVEDRRSRSISSSAASSISDRSAHKYRTPARSKSALSDQNYQQSVRRISSSLELRRKTAQGAVAAETKRRKQRGGEDEFDEAVERMSLEMEKLRRSILPAPERATLLLQEEFPTLDNVTYHTLTMSFIASESAAAVFCAAGLERRRAQVDEIRGGRSMSVVEREQRVQAEKLEGEDDEGVKEIDFTALDIDIDSVL